MNLLTKTVIKEQFFAGRAERLSQINLRLKYFTMLFDGETVRGRNFLFPARKTSKKTTSFCHGPLSEENAVIITGNFKAYNFID